MDKFGLTNTNNKKYETCVSCKSKYNLKELCIPLNGNMSAITILCKNCRSILFNILKEDQFND